MDTSCYILTRVMLYTHTHIICIHILIYTHSHVHTCTHTLSRKVNGLCICYRIMDYKYTLPPTLAARRSTLAAGEKVQKRFEQVLDYGSGTADGGRDLGKRFEGMRVYDDEKETATASARPRSGSDITPKSRQFQVNFTGYAPSPPESPSIQDSDPLPPYSEKVYPPVQGQHHDMYKVNLTDYNPSPVFAAEKPVSRIESDSGIPPKYPPTVPPTTSAYVGEVVTAKVSYSLGSAPPPALPTSQYPSTSSSYQADSSSPYPPPSATTATTTTAGATTFNPNPISYQPSPSAIQSSYPPPPPPSQPAQQQYQSYPPTAPPTGKDQFG